tara:strand:+ start:2834 stop:3049 length:216 start_codon:yes stop_codon:yes gene_type:complete
MKTRTYRIPCSWQVYATAEVEAESWDDAIKKVEDDNFPLPLDTDYVDASFEVDMEIIEEEIQNPNTFGLVD